MFDYEAYLRRDSDSGLFKSINDKKKYRSLKLDNDLRVLIIQDCREESKSINNDNQPNSPNVKRMRTSPDSTENEMVCDTSNSSGADKMAAISLTVNVGCFDEPKELHGLAHFTEHVVLMGNNEFPKANEFDNYVLSRSGYVNAHTENEYTIYEAEIPNVYLDECLRRFAACFKGPLLRAEHIESELNPVNNEYVDAFVDDDVRCDHFVSACLGKKDHVCSRFSWGSEFSLKKLPESKGIDVRAEMVNFFEKNYKANRMVLAIQSQESLDNVEKAVKEYFSGIPTEQTDKMTSAVDIDEIQMTRDLLSKKDLFAEEWYPYTRESMNYLYKMKAIEDGHTLNLIYVYPPISRFFKSKPLHIVGSILGYEGKNSLIQFLIKQKLILEFTVSQDDTSVQSSKNFHSQFSLIIKLTDLGLEKVCLVIRYIDWYIDLIARSGSQERIFNEERLISMTDIRFEDEEKPLKNVMNISKQAFIYPPEFVILGPKLLYEYNADAVKYCIDFLKNQPRLTVILSKKAFSLSNSPVQSDFWSDIEYKVEPLPEELTKPLDDATLVDLLKIPPPNEFISSDFELKSQQCSVDNPIVIAKDDHYKCFFKYDNVFKKPKAIIFLIFQSDYSRIHAEVKPSLQLFIKQFLLGITEQTYPAEMANLRYSIQLTRQGIELQVHGFNHKLLKLLNLIIDELFKFEINSDLFDTFRLDNIREYYNLLINNELLAPNVLSHLTVKHSQLYSETREIVKKLNPQSVREHVINFFRSAYLQCLIQGNFTQNEAKEIFDSVTKRSSACKEEVNVELVKKQYINRIPEGNHYCYLKSFNKSDEFIFVMNNYDLGKLNEDQIVMLDLVMQEMKDPLFDLLRTERMLCYYLYNKYSRSTNNICSFQIVIKSLADRFIPQFVDQQIEWFLDEFLEKNILNLSEEHFKSLVEARIKCKQVPFLTLAKEAAHNWGEIYSHTNRFNRRNEEIEILKNLDQAEFVEFAKWLLDRTANRKKLSVCTIGFGEKTEEEFLCSNDTEMSMDEEDESNNDKRVYSLIHMKPKSIDTDCKLIEDVEKWTQQCVCYE